MSTLFSSLTTTAMVLLLLLLVGTIDGGAISASSCLSSETLILLRIKEDLRLSNGRLSSWVTNGSNDCCMWEGVACDPCTGHVIGLQLRGSTKTESFVHMFMDIETSLRDDVLDSFEEDGSIDPRDIVGSRIPPSLFELHQLQHLDLSGCDFNGSAIPPELAQLTRLTHLNLSRSWFSGRIPHEIASLSNLVSLDLSYISPLYFDVPYDWLDTNYNFLSRYFFNLELENLEGFVQNFKHLEYLHLDSVRIELRNRQEWSISLSSALPNLRSLSLASCDLEGSLFSHMFKLTYLQALDLSNNHGLNGELMSSFFSPESNLQSLRLAFTSLSGRLPSEIFELPLLKVLDMANNFYMSGSLPINIGSLPATKGNFTALTYLDLSLTHFSGSLPPTIGNLTTLTHLDLHSADLSGSLPSTIGNLKSLTHLDLSDTYLSGSLPPTIGNFIALTHLNLRSTDLSGSLPPTIGNLTALTHLNLYSTNLSGSLPSTIGNLKALTHLDLSGMGLLSGSFPPTIGNLTALTDLHLSGTHLSGHFPNTIRSLPALSYLDMSDCMLTSILDSSFFVNLTQLTHLDLSKNMISGSLPSLPQYLRTIRLNSNNFSGPIPNSYSPFKLMTLDLSYNSLTGTIASSLIHGPSSVQSPLQYLDLSNNKFDGYLDLGIFSNFKKLSFLSLSGNNFTVDVHNPIIKFPSLQVLRLVSCNTNQFPQFLRHHKPIDTLDLSNNKITGEIPKWLNVSSYLNISHNLLTSIEQWVFLDLDTVDLSFNMLNSLLNSFFPSTGSFVKVHYFSISDNNVIGKIPVSLCNFTWLSFLDLSNNKLTGQIPECFFNLTMLVGVMLQNNQLQGQIPEFNNYTGNRFRILDLSDNMLEGNIPTFLGYCEDLELINLGHNKLSGGFPSWLGKLPNLRVLVLRSNYLSGAINFTFNQNAFQELLLLDVSTNQFNGKLSLGLLSCLNAMKIFSSISTIPGASANGYVIEWKVTVDTKGTKLTYEWKASMMTMIDLSDNYFEGEIPKEIGDLSGLQALKLSHNKLKGPIPKSIGALEHLESLDLSHNYLSGVIPEELTALNSLGYLNLSYNNLSGKIPQSPHFSTFDVPSFEGNPSLCGPPLSLPCEANISTTFIPFDGLRGEDEEKLWKYISIEAGFGVGFGTAISFSYFLNNGMIFNNFWRCYCSYA